MLANTFLAAPRSRRELGPNLRSRRGSLKRIGGEKEAKEKEEGRRALGRV